MKLTNKLHLIKKFYEFTVFSLYIYICIYKDNIVMYDLFFFFLQLANISYSRVIRLTMHVIRFNAST